MNRRQIINKILHDHIDVNKYEDYTNYKKLMTAIEEWHESEVKKIPIHNVSNRLLAEKIILALDDYGRKTHSVEYGLPIDPDTKDFEDKRPQEMLKIVVDILNG